MKILVTGATGTIGQHIVNHLVSMRQDVRVMTRNPEKANFPASVEVVAGDLTKSETFEAALKDVVGLHLITFDGGGYVPLQNGAELVAMAEKAGVKRVTVLQSRSETTVEQAMKASSLAWTLLNPVEFMSNIVQWAPMIRAENCVKQPFGNRKTAIVHESDIGAVAATVLSEDGHGGKTYAITGPEVLTPRLMTAQIGEAIGREVQFVELTPDQAQEVWRAAGHPQYVIDFFLWVYGNPPPVGYTLTTTVEDITGRPARSFAQWAREHAKDFGA